MTAARAAYTSLIRALDQSETESSLGKKFVPDDKFDEVFTIELLEQIVEDLLGPDGRTHITTLYHRYRKTIAILVWMTWESRFVCFWNEGSSDHHLPLDQETLGALDENLWWPKFNELQYKFLAQLFREENESLEWSEDYVLPIIAKEWRSKGGFSTVFRIKIHPHYDFLNYQYEDGDHQQHWYALKQLKNSEDAMISKRKLGEWQDEVSANALVRKQQHENILPLLHSHRYGSICNLIFPLASYNLKEFYDKTPHPPPWHQEPEPRLRFVEKISRLVPALGAIHQGKIDSQSCWVGSHRDLKPANILVFGNTQRFMISDLGLMRYREVKSGAGQDYSAGVDWGRGTSAYKAPECDEDGKKVGRGADIWSMGCILAEAISWCVCGKEGIERFTEKRRTKNMENYTDDWFFSKYSSGQGGKKVVAKLKPEVRAWFDEIRSISKDPRGVPDPLICSAIRVVESMLRETPRGAKGRPTAEKIDCEFYTILKKEADRLHTAPHIEEPYYYSSHHRESTQLPRMSLPFSYSRSTSLMGPTSQMSLSTKKRRRSEDVSLPPTPIALSTQTSNMSTMSQTTVRPLKRKRDVSAFIHLKRLDTMFLVDDYVTGSEAPWSKIRASIQSLAKIATVWDQDGVDLAFINSRYYFSCLATTENVLSALDSVGPSAEIHCTLQRRLDEMLSEYVTRYKEDQFTKPLNLIVVTSGDFVRHDQFERPVMEWAKELDMIYAPKSQLGLQFVLVGCRGDNVKRFNNLDENMWKVFGVRDMVDATCYDPDAPEDMKLLEKIMCGGMIKTFDRLDEDELEEWEMLGVATGY